jgi:chaperonin cofactor prefoldin
MELHNTKEATANLSTHKHMQQLTERLQADIQSLKALSQTLKEMEDAV